MENGKMCRVTSDGYSTFLIERPIPEGRVTQLKIYIENTYGRNLHFGVTKKYDASYNKFSSVNTGWANFI